MKKVWIAWEIQRRTTTLAKELNAKLFQFTDKGKLRYPIIITKTLIKLIKERPKILFVQNPSTVLTFLACVFKPISRYRLIVDRHTLFNTFLKNKIINFFDNYSLNHADLTIVTNKYLKNKLLNKNPKRKIQVLPDKIPEITHTKKKKLKGKFNAVFICTWADDEPYKEVIEAAKLLNKNIFIYITGKPKIKNISLPNIIITGFILQKDYDVLLQSADVILDFTKEENCLVCGAYEALAVEKPLITSDTKILKEYFSDGVIHVKHTPKQIAQAIKKAVENKSSISKKIKSLKQKRKLEWNHTFNQIQKKYNL